MMNGTNLHRKVTAMSFRLIVIVPTTKVEAMVDEADIHMEDMVIILDMVVIASLEP
jgi:hypothetical protein